MSLNAKKVLTILFITLIVSIIVWITFISTKGVKVSIQNESEQPISNVTLFFTGGEQHIPLIEPFSSQQVSINPDGESSLEISFIDSNNMVFKETIDVYFEHNYKGELYLTIDSNKDVTWKSEISIP